MIIRTHHNQDNPYVVINHTVLRDARLSWKATGIGAYLLAQPDNWQANVRHLSKQKKDGRDAVSSGLKELEDHYYLSRSRERNPETGQFDWVVDFYESYELNPAWQRLGEEARQKILDPCTGFPYTAEPYTDKPDTGEPYTENPSLINNKERSNQSTNNKERNNQQPAVKSAAAAEIHPPSLPEPTTDNPVGTFFEFWKQNMPGSLTELIVDELNDLIHTYGIAEVQYAAEQAVRMNKRFLKYVAGTCRNRAAGIEPGQQHGKHRNVNQPTTPATPAKPGQERFSNLLE